MKSLTQREKDIMLYLVMGYSNEQIAKTLFISKETVKAHLKEIFKKLEVSNRVMAAVKTVKEELINLKP